MTLFRRFVLWLRLAGLLLGAGCLFGGCESTQNSTYRNNLDAMQTAQLQIKGQVFDVWLALTDDQRQRGLMQVTQDQLAARDGVERGMLFAFPDEENLAFWMYNTIIPLDIAYIDADGVIVKTYTMAALETRTYPSIEPAQFALEVKAGLLASLGIGNGDVVELPEAVFKSPQ